MPELPEVETVRNTLKKLVLHKTIRDVDIFYDKMLRNIDAKQLHKELVGKQFTDILRYGKYLIFILGDTALLSHLRMEGRYFIKNMDLPRDKHEHMIIYFEDGETLRYHDSRKFGTFDIVPVSEIYTNSPITKMGYEPFHPLCTSNYLKEKLQHKSIAIKTALLDQTIIAGLGNIYVDEVLFLSKIHPQTPASNLRKKDYAQLVDNAKFVLNKAVELGGTTIRSYTSSLGVTGRFQNELFVHTKQGEKCRICKTEIQKIKVNGRGTYFCPVCQKKT